MIKNFCCSEGLISAHTIGNPVEYTYCSDISGIKSTIDHFVILIELADSINKHSILDELENRSNHLPLCIEITLPVSLNNIDDTRYFIPKPKWHAVNYDTLSNYKLALDNMLNSCDIPEDILSCQNLSCEEHNSFIDILHKHIVSSLINAAQETVPFTQPYSNPSRAHPG